MYWDLQDMAKINQDMGPLLTKVIFSLRTSFFTFQKKLQYSDFSITGNIKVKAKSWYFMIIHPLQL